MSDRSLDRVRDGAIHYIRRITNSPLQFGVFVLATWFTSNGPAAYLLCPEVLFSPLQTCSVTVFGFIPVTVNAVHAAMHLVSGVIGLAFAVRYTYARAYALYGGVYYLFWGLSMLPVGPAVRAALGVDAFGSWVHVVEGVLLWAVLLAWGRARQGHAGTLIR